MVGVREEDQRETTTDGRTDNPEAGERCPKTAKASSTMTVCKKDFGGSQVSSPVRMRTTRALSRSVIMTDRAQTVTRARFGRCGHHLELEDGADLSLSLANG